MLTYFCFVESDIRGTPHMEPLMATTDDDAHREGRVLMRRHASAVAAHIMLDDRLVATIRKDPAPRR